jgi:hypothetical protein
MRSMGMPRSGHQTESLLKLKSAWLLGERHPVVTANRLVA